MHYTTLNKIREEEPCTDGWEKLLKHLGKTGPDDEPLALKTILESNGIEDAVWCLRAVNDDKTIRLFSCDVAERVLPIWYKHIDSVKNKDAPKVAIEMSRKYAKGKATKEELVAACAAACAAAWAAAGAAARDAAWDASLDAALAAAWGAALDAARAAAWAAALDASLDAARAAAWDAERKEQEKLFIKYFCGEQS